jgi:hypothetical protein
MYARKESNGPDDSQIIFMRMLSGFLHKKILLSEDMAFHEIESFRGVSGLKALNYPA